VIAPYPAGNFTQTNYVGAVRDANDTWYRSWTCDSGYASFGSGNELQHGSGLRLTRPDRRHVAGPSPAPPGGAAADHDSFCAPAAALAQARRGGPPVDSADRTLRRRRDCRDAAEPRQQPAARREPVIEVSAPGADAPADIVVRGRRNIVRATPEVVSVLSSEDIARTGEGDIAGALQRVPGLSVVGNGFVYVRGLGDRYSLALLNGLALPSPEPLRRVVPLDIFPTSVIGSALVQKSYSVNYPGEFGGGVINLTTTAIPRASRSCRSAPASAATPKPPASSATPITAAAPTGSASTMASGTIDGVFGDAFRSNRVIGEGTNFTRARSRRSPPTSPTAAPPCFSATRHSGQLSASTCRAARPSTSAGPSSA
jgi:hypothetical protein